MRSKPNGEPRMAKTFNIQASFGGLVVTVGTRLSERGKAALASSGLSHLSFGRIGVLSILLVAPTTQAELCKALRQKPPSMGELLERLAKDGLVFSTPDKTDRRKTNWALTPQGRRDIEKARTVMRKTGRRLDRSLRKMGVSEKELDRFKAVLAGLLDDAS